MPLILPTETCWATSTVTLNGMMPVSVYAGSAPLGTSTFILTRVIGRLWSGTMGSFELIVINCGGLACVDSINAGQVGVLNPVQSFPCVPGNANVAILTNGGSGSVTVDVIGYWV